jgi:undecaprenyl-diphosphatase
VGVSNSLVSTLVTFFAEYLPFLIVPILLLLCVYKKEGRWQYIKDLLIIGIITVFAWALSSLIKHLLPSLRPYKVFTDVHPLLIPGDDGSFPSGHTTAFSTLAFAYYYFGYKKLGGWLLGGAVCIGVARIMAGVHFPFDILGGLLLGFIVARSVLYIKKKFWGEIVAETM